VPDYRVPYFTEPMRCQLLNRERLPSGAYNIEIREEPSDAKVHGQRFAVYVDGAAMRSGLTEAAAMKVATLLRAAFTTSWCGRR